MRLDAQALIPRPHSTNMGSQPKIQSSKLPPSALQVGGSLQKKWQCSVCNAAFLSNCHLARHSKIHTGEREFECLFPGCGSRWARKDNLQQQIHCGGSSRRATKKRRSLDTPHHNSTSSSPLEYPHLAQAALPAAAVHAQHLTTFPPVPLLPMISRRAAYNRNPEGVMSNFDYRPSSAEHLLPPAYLSYIPYPLIDASMFSPSTSCSSGQSSPTSGPFTPSVSYSHISPLPSDFTMLPTANVDDPHTSERPASDSSASLMAGDFDICSIPPIKLGMNKDHHQHLESIRQMETYSPVYNGQLYHKYKYESQQHFVDEHPEFCQFSTDIDLSNLMQGYPGAAIEPLTAQPLPHQSDARASY
ncbi:transcriptional repressor [Marasmius tenuissimus]|nr:transcriptional repressor [Marasmius tenuissimus]